MDMVEKVAGAMLSAHDFSEGGFDAMTDDWKGVYRDMARAAIEAMKEPSEEMIEAGSDGRQPGNSRWGNTTKTWSAMIRAALESR